MTPILSQLINLIDLTFQLLYLCLLIRVLLSWIPHNRFNRLIAFIYEVTDPILIPFQNLLPSWKIGIDLSPILAFFALGILKSVLIQIVVIIARILG